MPLPELQLLHEEMRVRLSFWSRSCRSVQIGASEARKLLALWAAVQRFPKDDVDDALFAQLDRLLKQETTWFVQLFLADTSLDGWQQRCSDVNRCWEDTIANDEAIELENNLHELFDELDSFSLALCATEMLLPPSHALCENVARLGAKIQGCEKFLIDHPEVFTPCGEHVSSRLAHFRSPLPPPVFKTILKFRVLENYARSTAEGPALPKIDPTTLP